MPDFKLLTVPLLDNGVHVGQPGVEFGVYSEYTVMDAHGTAHTYRVGEIVTSDGTAVEDMQAGEWDLTLFTCTVSGRQRITVRCERT